VWRDDGSCARTSSFRGDERKGNRFWQGGGRRDAVQHTGFVFDNICDQCLHKHLESFDLCDCPSFGTTRDHRKNRLWGHAATSAEDGRSVNKDLWPRSALYGSAAVYTSGCVVGTGEHFVQDAPAGTWGRTESSASNGNRFTDFGGFFAGESCANGRK